MQKTISAVRKVLYLSENKEIKSKYLVNELRIGEKSRIVKNFDRDENLKKLHAKYLNNEIENK